MTTSTIILISSIASAFSLILLLSKVLLFNSWKRKIESKRSKITIENNSGDTIKIIPDIKSRNESREFAKSIQEFLHG